LLRLITVEKGKSAGHWCVRRATGNLCHWPRAKQKPGQQKSKTEPGLRVRAVLHCVRCERFHVCSAPIGAPGVL